MPELSRSLVRHMLFPVAPIASPHRIRFKLYSVALMPDRFIRSFHVSSSEAMKFANSAGDSMIGSKLSLYRASFVPGDDTAPDSALFNKATISPDVPPGTISPNQLLGK